MIIAIIVAVAKNNVIGKRNSLPWLLPGDLKHFKSITMGHHILMGQNTYESIGRILPGRTTIILSNDPEYFKEGCIMARTPNEAIQIAEKAKETELMICGGGMVYKTFLPFADKIYMTKVGAEIDGDIFFPEINYDEWKLVSSEPHEKDDKNLYPYEFTVLERKRS